MNRSTEKRFVLIPALAAVATAMLVGPGANATTPVKTFRGVCGLEGTRAVATYSFGSSQEKMVAQGRCLASINGQALQSHAVRLVTETTVPLVDIGSGGSGWLKFVDYGRRLNFRFKRVAGRALMISGSGGSQATATLQRRAKQRVMMVIEASGQLRGL